MEFINLFYLFLFSIISGYIINWFEKLILSKRVKWHGLFMRYAVSYDNTKFWSKYFDFSFKFLLYVPYALKAARMVLIYSVILTYVFDMFGLERMIIVGFALTIFQLSLRK